ncbi:glycoside hydrolase domain-containing protein [Cutibacterium avidum]|uniref:glycoside hydrolase domain-containing protein n=1 Tax=Cutibacterium avidum TaxID=33010 RepID=UPI001E58F44B|nr:glycoside hydrolase domain-containing protein [Cutibacterium avidum]MCT1415715.1 DUF1906 domain-containing protein [Cutibacterium avidum]MCX8465910.1 DUF1906 domain-containing protein [Cutibacterium avidum]MCX8468296.1 DUF1906 domain-containing protein [Cutibacterium avidum]MDQ9080463.1 DUF1906 domain-containing protein [Cutibacterium avidum]MDU5340977.1 DUF1906 domain-containing protein [Cutibacterium avidum]
MTHFTVANGHRHAKEAQAAAQRLGVPPTIIYFAVDYDATDPEVDQPHLSILRGCNPKPGHRISRMYLYPKKHLQSRITRRIRGIIICFRRVHKILRKTGIPDS